MTGRSLEAVEPRAAAFLRVAVRCPFGAPAVTVQSPYDSAGDPFPTTFYLTCRHLVAAVARLEAAGGIERWSELAASDEELARSLEAATAEQRVIRRDLANGRVGRGDTLDLGIGGTANPQRLKCLHATSRSRSRAPDTSSANGSTPNRAEMACSVLHPGRPWQGRSCGELSGNREAPVGGGRPPSEGVKLRSGRLRDAHGTGRGCHRGARRRIGEHFSLAQLAGVYGGDDGWVYEAVAERADRPGWTAKVSVAQDAAFHRYARGATDYTP